MSKAGQEEQKRKSRPPPRGQRREAYPGEVKLRAVRLHLEEGYPLETIGRELGVSKNTIYLWVKRYRSEGEEGL